MYERNAIVFERYFDELLGYDNECNLKSVYKDYVNLVNSLEKYQKSMSAEDKIMIEYEEIANRIKNIQKEQKILYNRNIKLQNDRNNLFSEIGENSGDILKKITDIEKELEENETALRNIGKKFIEAIEELNEKIETRTQHEKENRAIDITYKKCLDAALNSFSELNIEKVKLAKNFYEQDVAELTKDISEKVAKNGAKERVKFNEQVINKAIQVYIDINKREVECLNNIFERIGILFSEIKNDNVKIEKHKKTIKDVAVKLDFLNAEKDYIILFLDNERLNVMSGEKEHQKLMEEACKYLECDLIKIENLYELLLKEISGKATKKAYKELYDMEYLYNLEIKQKEFELQVSKYNLLGTIINPDYWRVDGINKIYDIFNSIVIETFNRDLSEYEYHAKETELPKIETQIKTAEKNEKQEEKNEQQEEKSINKEEEETIKEKPENLILQKENNEEEIRRKKLDKILEFFNNDLDILNYNEEISKNQNVNEQDGLFDDEKLNFEENNMLDNSKLELNDNDFLDDKELDFEGDDFLDDKELDFEEDDFLDDKELNLEGDNFLDDKELDFEEDDFFNDEELDFEEDDFLDDKEYNFEDDDVIEDAKPNFEENDFEDESNINFDYEEETTGNLKKDNKKEDKKNKKENKKNKKDEKIKKDTEKVKKEKKKKISKK